MSEAEQPSGVPAYSAEFPQERAIEIGQQEGLSFSAARDPAQQRLRIRNSERKRAPQSAEFYCFRQIGIWVWCRLQRDDSESLFAAIFQEIIDVQTDIGQHRR